jgi:hypothetical protein
MPYVDKMKILLIIMTVILGAHGSIEEGEKGYLKKSSSVVPMFYIVDVPEKELLISVSSKTNVKSCLDGYKIASFLGVTLSFVGWAMWGITYSQCYK